MMKKIIMGILLVLVFVGCGNSDKKELKKVRFLLDWTPNTNHTGVYVAKEKGFFKEEGLEVEILPLGNDSTREVVSGGGCEFAVGYQPDIITACDKKLPIITLATILQDNTGGYLVNKTRGINRARDLAGKRYGGFDTPVERAILKRLIDSDGGDGNNINFLNIYSEDIFLALKGDMDYVLAFKGWEGIEIETKKLEKEYGFISFDEYDKNFQFYSHTIIANKNFVDKNPEITKKFMRAVQKGYEYCIAHPKESGDILLKYAPSLNKDLVYKSQEYLTSHYKGNAKCWGYMDKKVWDNFSNFLKDEKVIDRNLNVDSLYTNRYLSWRENVKNN